MKKLFFLFITMFFVFLVIGVHIASAYFACPQYCIQTSNGVSCGCKVPTPTATPTKTPTPTQKPTTTAAITPTPTPLRLCPQYCVLWPDGTTKCGCDAISPTPTKPIPSVLPLTQVHNTINSGSSITATQTILPTKKIIPTTETNTTQTTTSHSTTIPTATVEPTHAAIKECAQICVALQNGGTRCGCQITDTPQTTPTPSAPIAGGIAGVFGGIFSSIGSFFSHLF